MFKQFMPEVSKNERIHILQSNADKIEETTYQKPLTEDEINVRREELTDNSIKLNDLEEDKKETTKVFKDRIDPLKAANKILLSELRTGQAKVTGTIYYIANHDEGMMETYDHDGMLLGSRRLRPDEKQQNLYNISKTATN